MPLLYKKPFVKNKVPADLKPSNKVFYCEVTNEVFKSYDQFWERLVVLNALVWTCELTGKPGLTYQEAVDSEKKARKNVSNLSPALKNPILYITNLTKRGKLSDLNEDVFSYVRDRYFVGEPVEAIITRHWYDCKVTRVIMPSKQQIAEYEKEMEDTDDEGTEPAKSSINTEDDEISVLRDDHKASPSTGVNGTKAIVAKEGKEHPPYGAVRYEVIEIEAYDYKECKKHIVRWDQIRRTKSALTRDKCKMFIKQCIALGSEGYYVVKDTLLEKYNISGMKYLDIFVGNQPHFEHSKGRKSIGGSPKKKEPKHKLIPEPKLEPKAKKPKLDLGEVKVHKLTLLKKKETEKADKEKQKVDIKTNLENQRAEKKKLRESQKEEKRLKSLFMAVYNQPREDLLCADSKKLPTATPIQCKIPEENIGDFLMLLQFINAFADVLELKDVYSQGISFEMLEHAFVEKEVVGIFNDILQLIIGAIFSLQKEEEEEIKETVANEDFKTELGNSKSVESAIKLANEASNWIQQSQNVTLQTAHLDALTLTELIRIHLLASGATNNTNLAWRLMNRGGFQCSDDPGLHFKIDEPEILEKLSKETIFELSIGEKMKVLRTLVDQILTYASVRDTIDEKTQKLKEMNMELRLAKMADGRREKEDTLMIKQKQREDKQKKLDKKQSKINGDVDPVKQEMDENENEEVDDELLRLQEEKELLRKQKQKAEFDKQICQMMGKICTLGQEVHQLPLGEDRCYRKYWLFSSVPAFVVEDFDCQPGKCIDETPVRSLHLEDEQFNMLIKKQAIKNTEALANLKQETNSSDKENNSNAQTPKSPKASTHNLLQETVKNIAKGTTPLSNGSMSPDQKLERAISDSVFVRDLETKFARASTEVPATTDFDQCSLDPKTCQVHNSHDRPRWSVYKNVEEFQSLIDSLNPRGEREIHLKENLLHFKDVIEKAIKDCPVHKFDPNQEEDTTVPERKSTRGQQVLGSTSENLNFPSDTPVAEIFELTMRDMILELEDNLMMGMLGSIKDEDRDMIRASILGRTPLSPSFYKNLDVGGRKRLNELKNEFGLETEELVSGLPEKLSVMDELKVCILLVGQSVEAKHLKAPLGESEKSQKRRINIETKLRARHQKYVKVGSEPSDDEEVDKKSMSKISDYQLRLPSERWEKSLINSTSFSQLFLHLATLQNSVVWSRSALKACCCKCKKKSDPEHMLLCDECNRGYHMYCLKPKIKSVPSGDWFCEKCKPKEKPKSPKKRRKMYCEISDDEEDEEEEDYEPTQNLYNDEPNNEYCYTCGSDGELILCDTCPQSFHLECADLRKVPRGNWSCPLCRDIELPVSKKSDEPTKSDRRSSKRGTKRPLEEVEPVEYQRVKIDDLLGELLEHELCWPFRSPLSKTKNPDYYDKIKKPMDFRTVKNRFKNNKYASDAEFIADVLLIFQNCQQYFKESAKEYKASVILYKYFMDKVDEYELSSGGQSLKPPSKKRK